MTLETERLLLRPWEAGDAAALYKYASDPLVGPAAGWAVHKNIGESRKALRTSLARENIFAMALKETGEAVGSVSLERGPACGENELELGYWLGRPYWGRGLTAEAAQSVIGYGFRQLQLQRIWSSHFFNNQRSERLAQKLGFHGEGYRVSVWPDGREELAHFYALDRAEWQEKNAC